VKERTRTFVGVVATVLLGVAIIGFFVVGMMFCARLVGIINAAGL